MQMCGDCGKVYDESEYSRCPYCHGWVDDDREEYAIIKDLSDGQVKSVPKKDLHLYKY